VVFPPPKTVARDTKDGDVHRGFAPAPDAGFERHALRKKYLLRFFS